MWSRFAASFAGILVLALGSATFAQTKSDAQLPPATAATKVAQAAPSEKKAGDAKTSATEAGDKAKPAPQSAAPATTGVATVTTGWSVGCASAQDPGKLRCEVTNAVVLTSVNQRFVSVAVRRDLATPDKIMVVTLPHGVLFTAGILAQIDGKEAGEFEPLSSDQQGAYAKLKLTADNIQALEKGQTLTIVFDGTSGQKFTVAIALTGFAAAHDKMKAGN